MKKQHYIESGFTIPWRSIISSIVAIAMATLVVSNYRAADTRIAEANTGLMRVEAKIQDSERRQRAMALLRDLNELWREATEEEKQQIAGAIEVIYTAAPPQLVPKPGWQATGRVDVGKIGDQPVGGKAPTISYGLQAATNYDFYPLRLWSDLMHSSGPWRATNATRRLAAVDTVGYPTEPAVASLKTQGFRIPPGPYQLKFVGGSVALTGDVTKLADGTYTFGEGGVSITSDGKATKIEVRHVDGSKYMEDTVAPLRGKIDTMRLGSLNKLSDGAKIRPQEMTELWTTLAKAGVAIPIDQQTKETYLQYEYNRYEPRWATRTPVGFSRYSVREGAPWEEIFGLARELRVRQAWIGIPLLGESVSDIEYATNLGALVAANWTGDAIIEVGNEWWNTGFPFDDMALERASTIEEGCAIIVNESWNAFRSGYISAGGNPSKIKLAVLGWILDPRFLENIIRNLPAGEVSYAGASFYLPASRTIAKIREDARTDAALSNWTGRSFLDDIEAEGFTSFVSSIMAQASVAKKYGAKPCAYEGNISAIIGNLDNLPAARALVFNALDDPYAGTLFRKMTDTCRDSDYAVICAFAWMHAEASAKDGVFSMWKRWDTPRPTGQAYLDLYK